MGKEEKQWSCELGSLEVWQGPPEGCGGSSSILAAAEWDLDVEMLQDRSADRS